MNTLTDNERCGLDDVFLSIHSKKQKYPISRCLSSLLLIKNKYQKRQKYIKPLKKGVKFDKIMQLLKKND